jgi:hypothetical protein
VDRRREAKREMDSRGGGRERKRCRDGLREGEEGRRAVGGSVGSHKRLSF